MSEMTPALQKLADLGLAVDSIPDAQRDVLANLSDEEATVLAGILDRMAPEVEGHSIKAVAADVQPWEAPALKNTVANPGLRRPPGLADDSGGFFW